MRSRSLSRMRSSQILHNNCRKGVVGQAMTSTSRRSRMVGRHVTHPSIGSTSPDAPSARGGAKVGSICADG
eukprot:950100-Amphidinium_carterae.1